MPDWLSISQQVQTASGIHLSTDTARPVSGGCINTAYMLTGNQNESRQPWFIKINTADNLSMFEAEAEGLQALIDSHTLRAPTPVCSGITGKDAWLVMEYIALRNTGDDTQLGNELAAMHQTRHPQFGWHRHNTIGNTPQLNQQTDDWVTFWAEQRLETQLERAGQNGAERSLLHRGDMLQTALSAFFTDYQPVPSLLHGDLWSGNAAFDAQGLPVIFDPAVYFGDRETDLAMTELFGGFSPAFYNAYNAAWPLDAGYATRKTLYNVYHILNHFNLFGGDYQSQALSMINRLLSECR